MSARRGDHFGLKQTLCQKLSRYGSSRPEVQEMFGIFKEKDVGSQQLCKLEHIFANYYSENLYKSML